MRKPKAPDPAKIVDIRRRAGLTQGAAATLAMTSLRTFAAWEGGETRMHPAVWCWFSQEAEKLIKSGS